MLMLWEIQTFLVPMFKMIVPFVHSLIWKKETDTEPIVSINYEINNKNI